MNPLIRGCAALWLGWTLSAPVLGAGILTPKGAPQAPVEIRDHHVNVVINNGFAQTEVLQTFYNPNQADLEAIYSFPLPKSASLSEVSIAAGENEIHGEVLPKETAQTAYEEEKQAGNDTGKAEKRGFQTFEFTVHPVRALSETRIRFVYYQPLEIDTDVGRYVYPLEDGGVDQAAESFWERNEKVEGNLSIQVELKSASPIAEVRVPGFEAAAQTESLEEGRYRVLLERQAARLDRDFVLYYRLADNLPGRVELIAHRAGPEAPGTFMMILTPGLDLKPIQHGADYTFVLDVSGSMEAKMPTLAEGVTRALLSLKPEDRFRIVAFNSQARDLTRGFQSATPDNLQRAAEEVGGLTSCHSTDLSAGIREGLSDLDADRATSLILVTDGVANTGLTDPRAFHQLMKKHDVRVFGFLMGNSANWPLMRTICQATGGFHAAVSNDDDIIGQLLLARSKITHECLHDASLKIGGVKVSGVTGENIGKVYRGQQWIVFGRYHGAGAATVSLKARMTGEEKTYVGRFEFPEVDTAHPEIERLWALSQIESIEDQENAGLLPSSEAKPAIEDLGVQFQLVTDYTSMVLMSDEAFARRGIERRNQKRVADERRARAVRASEPPRNVRVDREQPMFQHPAPGLQGGGGNGGGALDPLAGLAALLLVLLAGACPFGKNPSNDGK